MINSLSFSEYALILSLPLGLLTLVFILLIVFPKIAEVERRIGTQGKLIDSIRLAFGGGPIGRWMRSIYVFAFFAFRRIPKFGPTIASRYGDEIEPLPLRLKLWVTVPHIVFFASAFVFLVSGLQYNGA